MKYKPFLPKNAPEMPAIASESFVEFADLWGRPVLPLCYCGCALDGDTIVSHRYVAIFTGADGIPVVRTLEIRNDNREQYAISPLMFSLRV